MLPLPALTAMAAPAPWQVQAGNRRKGQLRSEQNQQLTLQLELAQLQLRMVQAGLGPPALLTGAPPPSAGKGGGGKGGGPPGAKGKGKGKGLSAPGGLVGPPGPHACDVCSICGSKSFKVHGRTKCGVRLGGGFGGPVCGGAWVGSVPPAARIPGLPPASADPPSRRKRRKGPDGAGIAVPLVGGAGAGAPAPGVAGSRPVQTGASFADIVTGGPPAGNANADPAASPPSAPQTTPAGSPCIFLSLARKAGETNPVLTPEVLAALGALYHVPGVGPAGAVPTPAPVPVPVPPDPVVTMRNKTVRLQKARTRVRTADEQMVEAELALKQAAAHLASVRVHREQMFNELKVCETEYSEAVQAATLDLESKAAPRTAPRRVPSAAETQQGASSIPQAARKRAVSTGEEATDLEAEEPGGTQRDEAMEPPTVAEEAAGAASSGNGGTPAPAPARSASVTPVAARDAPASPVAAGVARSLGPSRAEVPKSAAGAAHFDISDAATPTPPPGAPPTLGRKGKPKARSRSPRSRKLDEDAAALGAAALREAEEKLVQ